MASRKFRFSFKKLLPIINFKFDYFSLLEFVKSFKTEKTYKNFIKKWGCFKYYLFYSKVCKKKKKVHLVLIYK